MPLFPWCGLPLLHLAWGFIKEMHIWMRKGGNFETEGKKKNLLGTVAGTYEVKGSHQSFKPIEAMGASTIFTRPALYSPRWRDRSQQPLSYLCMGLLQSSKQMPTISLKPSVDHLCTTYDLLVLLNLSICNLAI